MELYKEDYERYLMFQMQQLSQGLMNIEAHKILIEWAEKRIRKSKSNPQLNKKGGEK